MTQRLNKHFQNYNLTSCNETLFGSNYCAMKGYGPYSNKNNVNFLTGGGDKGKSPGKTGKAK